MFINRLYSSFNSLSWVDWDAVSPITPRCLATNKYSHLALTRPQIYFQLLLFHSFSFSLTFLGLENICISRVTWTLFLYPCSIIWKKKLSILIQNFSKWKGWGPLLLILLICSNGQWTLATRAKWTIAALENSSSHCKLHNPWILPLPTPQQSMLHVAPREWRPKEFHVDQRVTMNKVPKVQCTSVFIVTSHYSSLSLLT